MILNFGSFKGKELSDPSVPDDYVRWLASRGKYKSKENRFEYSWKVPVAVWMAALGEIVRRGYQVIGERIEKVE